jgi:hypothetical protein
MMVGGCCDDLDDADVKGLAIGVPVVELAEERYDEEGSIGPGPVAMLMLMLLILLFAGVADGGRAEDGGWEEGAALPRLSLLWLRSFDEAATTTAATAELSFPSFRGDIVAPVPSVNEEFDSMISKRSNVSNVGVGRTRVIFSSSLLLIVLLVSDPGNQGAAEIAAAKDDSSFID